MLGELYYHVVLMITTHKMFRDALKKKAQYFLKLGWFKTNKRWLRAK